MGNWAGVAEDVACNRLLAPRPYGLPFTVTGPLTLTSMRLGYFPQPYPREILYSILARCARHLGNLSQASLDRLLFGVERRRRNIAFSSRLGTIAAKLPEGCKITAETLLLEHTVFPYYAALLGPDQRHRAVASRLAETTTASFGGAGWKWFRTGDVLRFCSECYAAMNKRHGEAYWLREHQIPSVLVCPEHGTVLRFADMSSIGRRAYCAATMDSCPISAPPVIDDLTEVALNTLSEIAVRSLDLLSGHRTLLSKRTRPHAFQTALVAKGLGWGATFTDPVKLRRALIERFDHLECVWPNIFSRTGVRGSAAVGRIAGSGAEVSDPLMHILIAMTLESVPDQRPAFGYGPWSCPNQLAMHDSSLPVTRVERSRVSEDPVIGKFFCPCGHVFVRSEKRTGELSPYEVRVFGETLRPLLERAVTEKWAISRTAKAAGIGEGSLLTQARALGFEAPWEIQWRNQPTRRSSK